MGVETFIQECYNYTRSTSEEWKWYVENFGRWVDFDNSYKTMDNDYMESVWWVFKTIYDKDMMYEGKRVSMYSTKLSTPISNHEVAMDNTYEEVNDPAIVVKFDVSMNDGYEDNTFVLAWTTTPWTIPANMALGVHREIEYVKVLNEGSHYIVAKARVEDIFKTKGEYDIVDEFNGEQLIGLNYKPPFDYYYGKTQGEKDHTILFAEFATDDSGTGIVHQAPEFGEDDFNLSKAESITMTEAMDSQGNYTDDIYDLTGSFYRDANDEITKRLADI